MAATRTRIRHVPPRRTSTNRSRIQLHVAQEDPRTPGCCKHCNLPMTAKTNARHMAQGELLDYLGALVWQQGRPLPGFSRN